MERAGDGDARSCGWCATQAVYQASLHRQQATQWLAAVNAFGGLPTRFCEAGHSV